MAHQTHCKVEFDTHMHPPLARLFPLDVLLCPHAVPGPCCGCALGDAEIAVDPFAQGDGRRRPQRPVACVADLCFCSCCGDVLCCGVAPSFDPGAYLEGCESGSGAATCRQSRHHDRHLRCHFFHRSMESVWHVVVDDLRPRLGFPPLLHRRQASLHGSWGAADARHLRWSEALHH